MNTGEHLDIEEIVGGTVDVPCESRVHPRIGKDDAHAEWVIWPVRCCPARPSVGFACTDCLTYCLTDTRPVRCRDCGTRTERLRDTIIRFERVDRPARR